LKLYFWVAHEVPEDEEQLCVCASCFTTNKSYQLLCTEWDVLVKRLIYQLKRKTTERKPKTTS